MSFSKDNFEVVTEIIELPRIYLEYKKELFVNIMYSEIIQTFNIHFLKKQYDATRPDFEKRQMTMNTTEDNASKEYRI